MGVFGGPDPMDPALTSRLVKSISMSRISGFPGDTVSAFFAVDNPAGIAHAEFLMTFDQKILNFIRAVTTETTAGFDLQTIQLSDMAVKIILQSDHAIVSGPDSILQMEFVVNIQARSGEATQLVIGDPRLTGLSLSSIVIKSITDGVFVVNQGSDPGRFVYVNASGQPPGEGTRDYPFTTIQAAIDNSQTGDTVVVSAGTYPEKLSMKEGIYLRGSGAKVTFIRTPSDEVGIEFFHISEGELSGFTIKGPDLDPNDAPLIASIGGSPKIINNHLESFFAPIGGIACSDGSTAIIEDNTLVNQCIMIIESAPNIYHNEITGGMLGAIYSYNSAPNIEGNSINGGEMGDPGIFFTGSGIGIIKYNRFNWTSTGADAIYLSGAENLFIHNNVFSDQGFNGAGIRITNSTGITITNNTLHTSGSGVDEENSAVIFYNNIITGNEIFGLRFSANSIYDYNNSWNPGSNYYQCIPDLHGISADPLFVDPVAGDYHLTSGSPCIHAGHPDISYNDWNGTRNDMGAYGGPGADSTWIYGDGCKLEADSANAAAKDTVMISIDGAAIAGAARIDLVLSFDPDALKFLDARSTALSRSLSLTKTKLNAGSIQIILDGTQGVKENEGKLLELILMVDLPEGGVVPVRFEKAMLSDAALRKMNVQEIKDGFVSVTPTLIGGGKTEPEISELFQNYPNPFNNVTTIRYRLVKPAMTKLVIYNLLGQKVCNLVNGYQKAGNHSLIWNGTNDTGDVVASGLYFYQIRSDGFNAIKKLLFLK